jgi:pSer/pThr/pTyr-binding forkhead associated (FHA) protein
MSMAILYQIGEDGSQAEHWDISDEPMVVGRSVQAKVIIKDEGLSRRHFLIEREGEEYVIRDLNSRNGTWLDGSRIFTKKLHHNDCILAGRTRFLFTAPSILARAVVKGESGPHGTRIIPAERMLECDFSTSSPWQDACSEQKVEALA